MPFRLITIDGIWHTIPFARARAAREAKKGNLPAAVDILSLVLEQAPDDVAACFSRAVLYQKMDRPDAALADLDHAIALKPDYADALHQRGIFRQRLNRSEDALADYDKAIALKPADAKAYNSRGITLHKLGRHDEALASYEKALQLAANFAEAYNNRGATLQKLKRFAEAAQSYAQALALKPGYFEALVNRGKVLVTIGDMPEAEKMLRQACALQPDFWGSWIMLAKIRAYADVAHPDVKSMQSLLSQRAIPGPAKAELCFSLGKIYDDCHHYNEAFEYYRQANELHGSPTSYDAAATTRLTQAIIDVFQADLWAHPLPFASESRSPVFIVGMPRSGTTLLASILSNHPSIATAGELEKMGQLATGLRTLTGASYPEAVKLLTPAIAQGMIQEYLQRLRSNVEESIPYVVDKNPLNFQHVGLINLLFPKSTIIHCTRHPLDTGLSNYFARFGPNLGYSCDLRNIGHFYSEYSRLMAHWKTTLPGRILEVRYEDMVLATEPATQEVFNALELQWDDRCLAPHTNPTPIETASYWQVRQPIHPQSIGRWRNYETQLAPLEEILRTEKTHE